MTSKQREKIAEAIRTLGATETARRLGLSTEATLRLAGNFGTQAGTEALAAQRLDRLSEASDAD